MAILATSRALLRYFESKHNSYLSRVLNQKEACTIKEVIINWTELLLFTEQSSGSIIRWKKLADFCLFRIGNHCGMDGGLDDLHILCGPSYSHLYSQITPG